MPRRKRVQAKSQKEQVPLSVLSERTTRDCKGGFDVALSQKFHRLIPSSFCCHRANCTCPGCMARLRSRRARPIFKRLREIDPLNKRMVPILSFLFTLPEEVRDRLTPPVSRVLRRRAIDIVRRVLSAHVGTCGFSLGGVSCWHPHGNDPIKWQPHLNLILPTLAFQGTDRLYIRSWLPIAALQQLREEWGRLLAQKLNWIPPGGDPSKCVVTVKYFGRQKKIKRVVKYLFRNWPNNHGVWRKTVYFGYWAPRNRRIAPPYLIQRCSERGVQVGTEGLPSQAISSRHEQDNSSKDTTLSSTISNTGEP